MERDAMSIQEKCVHKDFSIQLFPYLINWCYNTRNVTALEISELDGKTPGAWLLGETDDIRHIIIHDFYDTVEYTIKPTRENPTYPKKYKDQNGQYLGPTINASEVNASYVLTKQVSVITRTYVRLLSAERLQDPVVWKRIANFDSKIKRLWKLNDEADV